MPYTTNRITALWICARNVSTFSIFKERVWPLSAFVLPNAAGLAARIARVFEGLKAQCRYLKGKHSSAANGSVMTLRDNARSYRGEQPPTQCRSRHGMLSPVETTHRLHMLMVHPSKGRFIAMLFLYITLKLFFLEIPGVYGSRALLKHLFVLDDNYKMGKRDNKPGVFSNNY